MTDDGWRRLSWPECVRTVHRRGAPAARTPGRSDDPRRRPARPPVKGLHGADPDKVGRIAEQFAAAEAVVATREAAVPTITYPDLPLSEKRGEIAKTKAERRRDLRQDGVRHAPINVTAGPRIWDKRLDRVGWLAGRETAANQSLGHDHSRRNRKIQLTCEDSGAPGRIRTCRAVKRLHRSDRRPMRDGGRDSFTPTTRGSTRA